MERPLASLIICSRNRPALLRDMVASVLQGRMRPAEIIVVDQSDAPHPELAGMAAPEDCTIRYHWTQQVGVSRARNAGAAAAHYPLLVFADDDMRATADWFEALTRALVGAGKQTVVTGQVAPDDEDGCATRTPSIRTDTTPLIYRGRIANDILYSGNMALYRSTYEAVGGFDERLGPGTRFPAAEDNDFGYRLLEAGYTIRYVPEAVLFHRAWRSETDYVRLRWNYGYGQGAFYAKHLTWRDPYMLRRLLRDAGRRLVRLPLTAAREPGKLRGNLAFLAGLLSGVAGWLRSSRPPARATADLRE